MARRYGRTKRGKCCRAVVPGAVKYDVERCAWPGWIACHDGVMDNLSSHRVQCYFPSDRAGVREVQSLVASGSSMHGRRFVASRHDDALEAFSPEECANYYFTIGRTVFKQCYGR